MQAGGAAADGNIAQRLQYLVAADQYRQRAGAGADTKSGGCAGLSGGFDADAGEAGTICRGQFFVEERFFGIFQDQRAAKVGDIITVNIEASDNASMKNKTEQYRDDNEDTVNINTLAGYEKYAKDYLPDTVDTSDLFNVMSNHDVQGEGKINRSEKINMTMAAVVTQVLPNDNLVIEGTQEIRVNYELRQLTVRGIIRRADIKSDNTIESSKIAELRVSYGGRGTVSDMQEPRYGRQLLDILSPF